MIVLVVDEYRVFAVEGECHPPIAAHRDGVMPIQIPDQGVQFPARQIHVGGAFGQVKPSQLPLKSGRVVWLYACFLARLEKKLQAFVAECFYHTPIV